MPNISPILLVIAVISLSSCATHKDIAYVSLGYVQNPGEISDSTAFKASGLALNIASRNIPGTMPSGVGIGISATKFLASGDFMSLSQQSNHFEAWMPDSEAVDEADATLKMSALMEKAIRNAFPPPYRTKIVEYDDISTLGIVSRYRHIWVDGPNCENWSCLAIGPIPTSTAYQWSGKMVTIDEPSIPGGNVHYAYKGLQSVSFSKITKDFEIDGAFAGHWRKFESGPVPEFDYEEFFLRISGNLPDWVFYYIAPNNNNIDKLLERPALLNKGVKTFF